jgi:two-component system response regulator (stage 0 sporulation protein A)
MIKIGLIDQKELTDALGGIQGFQIVFSCEGRDARKHLNKGDVDVVVTEIVMSGEDGLKIIELYPNVKFIAASELKSEVFIQKALESGAKYYLLKPVSLEAVVERIHDCYNAEAKTMGEVKMVKRKSVSEKSLDERISNIFISVGIPAHIKGYQFLREGIKLAVDNPPIINAITKSLYPTIAKKFDTTSSKVERAIRHAIEVAWNRGKIENINSLFGVKVYSSSEKPTNGEFIALLSDKMLLECSY